MNAIDLSFIIKSESQWKITDFSKFTSYTSCSLGCHLEERGPRFNGRKWKTVHLFTLRNFYQHFFFTFWDSFTTALEAVMIRFLSCMRPSGSCVAHSGGMEMRRREQLCSRKVCFMFFNINTWRSQLTWYSYKRPSPDQECRCVCVTQRGRELKLVEGYTAVSA